MMTRFKHLFTLKQRQDLVLITNEINHQDKFTFYVKIKGKFESQVLLASQSQIFAVAILEPKK